MGAQYRGSYDGIGEMLRAPFTVAEMKRRIEAVEAQAVASAPVGDREHPGRPRYVESFTTEAGVRTPEVGAQEGFRPDRRAYGRLTNDAPHAYHLEYGTEHNEAHRTMRSALSAAGDQEAS